MEGAAFWREFSVCEVRILMKILQYLLLLSTPHPQHNDNAPAAWVLLAVSVEPGINSSLMLVFRSTLMAFEPRQAWCQCMT